VKATPGQRISGPSETQGVQDNENKSQTCLRVLTGQKVPEKSIALMAFRLNACLGLRVEFAEEVTCVIIFEKRLAKIL
jgi:hypothetical protein